MKTKIAAAVALAFASSFALAQAKQQESGWYVGGSVGRSSVDFNKQDYASGVAGVAETTDEHDTAYKLLVGYNFDKNWAVEGGYHDLGAFKYKYALGGATAEAKMRVDAWSFSVKGAVPVNAMFDVFGRLGATYNRAQMDLTSSIGGLTAASDSDRRWDALLGVGIEYKPAKNFGIRAEYDNHGRFGDKNKTGRVDADMWSVGLVLRF